MRISEAQGSGLFSPVAGQKVKLSGVVTIALRNGFFLQSITEEWDGQSSIAIFVYSPKRRPALGAYVEAHGEIVDYLADETAKPVTQLILDNFVVMPLPNTRTPLVVDFDLNVLSEQGERLSAWLNAAEGMLMRIPAGSRFIAPSNDFGDYVVAIPGHEHGLEVHKSGGCVVGPGNELTWFPGFRVNDYALAQQLDVGSTLDRDVVGALHYRVNAYQLSVGHPISVNHRYANHSFSNLEESDGHFRVMTLNCFNLDPVKERADRVINPRTDVDDDYGDGRFHSLAKAIVVYAKTPEVIALQEIQDNDGAEHTQTTDASVTYKLLLRSIAQLSDVPYEWVDLPPDLDADGGQPGGNIRNGFLYRSDRVSIVPQSLIKLGEDAESFVGSRKPLACDFHSMVSGQVWTVVNVHLASKRHQRSVFSPEAPGFDHKLPIRVEQASIVAEFAKTRVAAGAKVYVTGDFNDGEHSETLEVFTKAGAHNLVFDLPNNERFDYNHRGKMQVLMHGLVFADSQQSDRYKYEILHGPELIGVVPGEDNDRASDHAYVVAQLI